MPSTELTKAPELLDVENDQRDWFSEFREEADLREQSSRRERDTLFEEVHHSRPAPIVIAAVPEAAEVSQPPAQYRRWLLRRVKRALSPALTALFVLYVAAIILTGWIGIRGNEAARRSDLTVQASTPQPTETWPSSNDVP